MASGERGQGLQCIHWLLLLLATAGPTAVVLLVLSALPYSYGIPLYNLVSQKAYSFAGDLTIMGSLALLSLYYVLGIVTWGPFCRAMAYSIPWLGFMVALLLKARRYPVGPTIFIMSHLALLLFLCRRSVCKNVERRKFYIGVATLCALSAVGTMGAMAEFIDSGNAWDASTELRMAKEMPNAFKYVGLYNLGSPLNRTENCGIGGERKIDSLRGETQAKVDKACKKVRNVLAVVWSAPFIACFANIVAFMFALSQITVQTVNMTAKEMILKQFFVSFCFILGMIWMTMCMNNLSELLMRALMLCSFIALSATVAWAYWELDLSAIKREVGNSEVMKMMIGAKESDWLRALAVGSGFIPAFLSLEYMRQRCHGPTTSVEDSEEEEEEEEDSDFQLVSNLYGCVLGWNWTGILLKICILGEVFFTMQVGFSKLTSIFLSWMNVQLAGMDFTMLNVIMSCVGFFMFLCPAVPGAAVYLFIGLVDGVQGSGGDPYSMNFVKGCVTAVVVSAFTKLAACVGQYGIGFSMSRSTKVKQAVGVTSVQIRAMEDILKTPGMAVGKVAVLVCGPDWPVSVMCGIFRLNIPQMILGTTPVILVSIVPTVLAGAFQGVLVPGEESILATMATLCIMSAGLLQAGGALLMMNAVTRVIAEKGNELAKPRLEDADVEKLNTEQEQYTKNYNEINAWSNLSSCQRFMMIVAAALMLLHGAIVVGVGSKCFEKFEVSGKITNHIDDNGLGCQEATLSCALNNIIIRPGGFVVLGVFAVAVFLHVVLSQMLTRRARSHKGYERIK